MTLAFDSSILIEIEKRNPFILKELDNLRKIHSSKPLLPFMCYYEIVRGLKIRNPKDYIEIFEFVNSFKVIQITNKTAEILSDLKIKYDRLGKEVPFSDLFIATQAIENNLILVTKDKDFERISELKKIIF